MQERSSTCSDTPIEHPSSARQYQSAPGPALLYESLTTDWPVFGATDDRAKSCLDFASALKALGDPMDAEKAEQVAPAEPSDSAVEAMERMDKIEAKRFFDKFVTIL
jgi:hypothetical protein